MKHMYINLVLSFIILPKALLSATAYCTDTKSFTFINGGALRTCLWIRDQTEQRTQEICQVIDIRSNCAQSCGICCEDNPDYRIKDSVTGRFRHCAWIGKSQDRKDTYCEYSRKEGKVKDVCPLSCDYCADFVPLKVPTKSPSIFPTKSPSFRPTMSPIKAPTKSEPALTSTKPPKYHSMAPSKSQSNEPSDTPTQTPTQCKDDDDFTFKINYDNTEKPCSWLIRNRHIKKRRISRYCIAGSEVSTKCLKSCDLCATTAPSLSLAPSSVPSEDRRGSGPTMGIITSASSSLTYSMTMFNAVWVLAGLFTIL